MKRSTIIIIICIVCIFIFCLWLYIGNTHVQVVRFNVENSDIPSEFNGYQIALISDFHSASYCLDQLTSLIKQEQTDIIVIVGDIADTTHQKDIEKAVCLAKSCADILPTYYVTGNHEYEIETDCKIIEKIETCGVMVLRNSSVLLRKSNACIRLAGIDDPAFSGSHTYKNYDSITEKSTNAAIQGCDMYTILLAHRPEFIVSYSNGGADLVLSGHTHGGQFRLPFIGGVATPDQGLFPKYLDGFYSIDGTDMIVSMGIGSSVVRLRVNAYPEIGIVTLVSE